MHTLIQSEGSRGCLGRTVISFLISALFLLSEALAELYGNHENFDLIFGVFILLAVFSHS